MHVTWFEVKLFFKKYHDLRTREREREILKRLSYFTFYFNINPLNVHIYRMCIGFTILLSIVL